MFFIAFLANAKVTYVTSKKEKIIVSIDIFKKKDQKKLWIVKLFVLILIRLFIFYIMNHDMTHLMQKWFKLK